MSKVVSYISGVCRNNPEGSRSHLYAQTAAGNLWPMCDYGWNRSDGHRFSILRGWRGGRGHCKLCEANAAAEKRPVIHACEHKTRWL